MHRYFFDFDETIYKTSKSIVKYFEKREILLTNGYTEENCLEDLCKAFDVDDSIIRMVFESEELYTNNRSMFYEGSIDLINDLLNAGHYVSIVTVGEKINNENKKLLLRKILPGVDFQCKDFRFFKGISKKEIYDKSCFNMKGGFHLDDNEICLKTSNAKNKFMFRKKSKRFKTLNNFKEVQEVIDTGNTAFLDPLTSKMNIYYMNRKLERLIKERDEKIEESRRNEL